MATFVHALLLPTLLQASPLPAPPNTTWTTLRNGLSVGVVPRGQAPWCAVATALPGGSAADPPGRTGLAHLAEHLMFEDRPGEPRRDAMAEALGMLSNAFTLEDHTLVVDEFSPAVLRDALLLHAARMAVKEPTAEALSREKKVVADERRFRVAEPALGAADERMLSLLWDGTQHAHPVLGVPVDVDAVTPADVTAWMTRTLQPRHAATVVVGGCDRAQVLALLEETLGTWRAPAVASSVAASASPVKARDGTRTTRITGGEDAVLVAFAGAPMEDAQSAVDRVLAQVVAQADQGGPPLEVEFRGGWKASTVVVHLHDEADVTEERLVRVLRAVADGQFPPQVLMSARTSAAWMQVRELESHVATAESMAAARALAGNGALPFVRAQETVRVDVAAVKGRAAAWLKGGRAVVHVAHAEHAP